MRIDRLDLRAYGCFENRTLDLAAHHGKLVLVVGNNEAGKSTILSAISHWLFGFNPSHTGNESYQFGKDVLVGGTVSNSETSLTCLRTRKKKSLVENDGKTALADDVLKPFLRDLNKERFTGLFGLNRDGLCQGAEEIAKGGGDIGEALFTAASALQSLNAMRRKMKERREFYFKSGGKNPPINTALREHREVLDRVRQEQTSAKEASDLRDSIVLSTAAIHTATSDFTTAQRERQRMERAKSARPLFERRRRLREELAQLINLPELREDFDSDWRSLPEQIATLRGRAKKSAEDIQRLEEELKGNPDNDVFLAVAEAIQTAAATANSITQQQDLVTEDR